MNYLTLFHHHICHAHYTLEHANKTTIGTDQSPVHNSTCHRCTPCTVVKTVSRKMLPGLLAVKDTGC